MKRFTKTALSTFVSLCVGTSYASVVRNDIDYQYFRDFAENKGPFTVGAKNIPILNRVGEQVGIMFQTASMPDLGSVNLNSAVLTLFNPQYTSGVKHNGGIGSAEFGSMHPDAKPYSYLVVDRNNHPTEDYHIPRLNKLVTEVVPTPLSSVGYDGETIRSYDYLDSARFPLFMRVGSGIQLLRNAANKIEREVATGYVFTTGGAGLKAYSAKGSSLVLAGSVFANDYGPMATYGMPGDSGSPLFAFDTSENRWVLAGALKVYTGENGDRNGYMVSLPKFVSDHLRQDEVAFENRANTLIWSTTSPSRSEIRSQGMNHNVIVDVADPTKADQDSYKERPSLNNGKNLIISGNDGTLVLNDNINQGAGALHFRSNFTVRPQNDQTWVGAGVIVDNGKQVNWQVKNPVGDRLSKLGEGTLHVNGVGTNLGSISVGNGKVVLNQRADSYGNQRAFSEVGIVSGRATVSLANDKQVYGDNIYFGFRGGRLDLNGNAISFSRIANVDDGANIVNDNLSKRSVVTVTGGQKATANDIEWRKHAEQPTSALAINEYINTHQNNRKDYFAFKGVNPSAYYPTNAVDNSEWEFLGHDRNKAIQTVLDRENARRFPTSPSAVGNTAFNGFFGERESNKANGRLDVIYDTPTNSLHLVSGGSNLNGTFGVRNGSLLLSGRHIPYAKDYIFKHEIIDDHAWLNREFKATTFEASNNGTLYFGRNVQSVIGNLKASGNGKIQLGFLQGKTPVCTRSDYEGTLNCQDNAVLQDDVYFSIPTTQVRGNTVLSDNGWLIFGKTHLQGDIQGTANSRVSIGKDGLWTMLGNSTLGNLAMDSGTITLNPLFESTNVRSSVGHFNTLTINGNLTGSGRFNLLSNAGESKGDNIVVNGLATGVFSLALKNTGREANTVSPISLLKLNHRDQSRYGVSVSLTTPYVDLGAYRYILKNSNNDYRLYSPILDANGGQKLVDVERLRELAKQQQQEVARLEKNIEDDLKQQQKLENDMSKLQKAVDKAERDVKAAENWYARGQRFWSFAPRILARRAQNLEKYRTYLANAQSQRDAMANHLSGYRTSVESARALLDEVRYRYESTQNQLDNATQNRPAMIEGVKQKAKNLCMKEKYSESVCNSVVEKLASQDAEQAMLAFESSVRARDNAEQQVEMAESHYQVALQAVSSAEKSANADQIALAQKQLNDARLQVETAKLNLEQAKTVEAQAYVALNQVEATETALMNVNQADWISQYSNTALSEISAQANSLLRVGANLDRHLLNFERKQGSVWANYDWSKTQNRSDKYRPYEQRQNLTQLGVEQALNDNVKIGAVLSRAESNNDFDDNGSGKSRMKGISTFLTVESENGLFATLDAGYFRSKNRINLAGEQAKFNRNIFNIGANVGKRWNVAGVEVQPSIGARFYRLSNVAYQLDGANIENRNANFVSYNAGLKLAKTFNVSEDFSLTPSLASYYTDASNRKLGVKVNNHEIEQRFGRYFRHEVGIATKFRAWEVSANAGYLKGNEVGKQKSASLKVSYTW